MHLVVTGWVSNLREYQVKNEKPLAGGALLDVAEDRFEVTISESRATRRALLLVKTLLHLIIMQ